MKFVCSPSSLRGKIDFIPPSSLHSAPCTDAGCNSWCDHPECRLFQGYYCHPGLLKCSGCYLQGGGRYRTFFTSTPETQYAGELELRRVRIPLCDFSFLFPKPWETKRYSAERDGFPSAPLRFILNSLTKKNFLIPMRKTTSLCRSAEPYSEEVFR